MSERKWLDLAAIKQEYCLGRDVVLRAIHSGTLAASKSGQDADGNPVGKFIVKREVLDAWLDSLGRA